tara:strand:+ start:957 stop:1919 length:963 start_codon:yes stop_codon:yes gene_type:complete
MKILITGHAGFIGYHLAKSLLKKKFFVVGIDNFNSYYDKKIKYKRLKSLLSVSKNKFKNYKLDLTDTKKIDHLFKKYKFKYVVHLAAQAGVRFSINNPENYFKSNIQGTFSILNISKKYKIKHLIIGSSSSVYGNSKKFPLSENFNTDHPESFYAASKKSSEIMSFAYSNIYKIPITVLRFFTVYGPNGRPDMSLYKFSDLITKNKKIPIYNNGNHDRDFTYIDDVIFYITNLINKIPNTKVPFRLLNVANGKTNKLRDFLKYIQIYIGKKAKIKKLPIQKGDVLKTHADIRKLNKIIKPKNKTEIKIGVKKFIDWFKSK